MDEVSRTCAICNRPIEMGEAWMSSDQEGAEAVAHAGCVYAARSDAEERARWTPPEDGPNQ